MPAKSPAALLRQRERQRARDYLRTKAGRGLAPNMKESPFVGCDGEGFKAKDGSRYALFRMGERELFKRGKRLTTAQLLNFICEHPDPTEILVCYALEYDFSNIMRDVLKMYKEPGQPSRLERILSVDTKHPDGTVRKADNFYNQWTWLDFYDHELGGLSFGVRYIPRNYLAVCRMQTQREVGRREDGTLHPWEQKPIEGSERVIYDAHGFFQLPFVNALYQWEIGRKHWPAISRMKGARENFRKITPEIRAYCALECELLAQLMTRFRETCEKIDLIPKTWNGAGKLAVALLAKNDVIDRRTTQKLVKPGVLAMAKQAMMGGRFEVTQVGQIARPVWEHDQNSAYPAAMLTLPCLEHGTWRRSKPGELAGCKELFLCPVTFFHPREQILCGFPFRSEKGDLFWPLSGKGVYWSNEIRSAERLGATCAYGTGWIYEKRCGCQPFSWIADVYEQRRKLGKNTRGGLALKIALAALSGKFAQRYGAARFFNPVYASLINATVRASINDAIVKAGPSRVVMIATDAIYTTGGRIALPKGQGLGQWDMVWHPRLFIMRPGLYWPPKPPKGPWLSKRRGLPAKFYEPFTATAERLWAEFCKAGDLSILPPLVPCELENFVGLRYAYRRGELGLACQWLHSQIQCRFHWHNKRCAPKFSKDGKAMILAPLPGGPGAKSFPPAPEEWDESAIEHEALPDPLDLSIPFK